LIKVRGGNHGRETLLKYFEILGLHNNASTREIKAAFKKLALKWHPDLHQKNKRFAENKFAEIANAYSILIKD